MQIKSDFIIICKNDKDKLKTTINSLKDNFPESNFILVSENPFDFEYKILKCKNIASCINIGMLNSKSEWNCILTEYKWISESALRNYFLYIKSYKDLMYPIMNQQMNFIDNNLHRFLINKKAYNEIGFFREDVDFEISKILWANNAIDQGFQFKGVTMKV